MLRHQNLTHFFLKHIKNWTKIPVRTVVQNAVSDKTATETQSTDSTNRPNIATKYAQKKLRNRAPVAKDFFLGKIDLDLVAFPEVIERDDQKTLFNQELAQKRFFEELYSGEEPPVKIDDTVLNQLSEQGLFGLNISQHLGGRGYYLSESLLASEPETEDYSISEILLSHRSAVDAINKFGTEEQKSLWLPKLASGNWIATDAIFESKCAEDQLFTTFADSDNDTWVMNGEKSYIANGTNANTFIVLAQTMRQEKGYKTADCVTAFLIEDSIKGVTKTPSYDTYGSTTSCGLKFKDVDLKKENILGTLHKGNNVAQFMLRSNRIRTSHLVTGILKKFIKNLTDYTIKTEVGLTPLKDMEIAKKYLSELVLQTYAIESMTYYTAGLLDEFNEPDIDVEAAITKIYSLQTLMSAVSSGLSFLGGQCNESAKFVHTLLKNTLHFYTNGETLDSLRLFVGITGLHHTGSAIFEDIKKRRNPLFYPGTLVSKFFETSSIDNPKPTLNIGEAVHPSLVPASQYLEFSILRLKMATETLLGRYGNEVANEHIDVLRLSDCVILIYGMYACISRASRSYCIGLQHSNYELLMASTFCADALNKIKFLAVEVHDGTPKTSDVNHGRVAEQLFKSSAYFAEHPLKYNF